MKDNQQQIEPSQLERILDIREDCKRTTSSSYKKKNTVLEMALQTLTEIATEPEASFEERKLALAFFDRLEGLLDIFDRQRIQGAIRAMSYREGEQLDEMKERVAFHENRIAQRPKYTPLAKAG